MRDVLALLETELQAAFEVKDRDALHRYAVLMLERFAARDRVEKRTETMTESIDRLSTEMKEEFSKVHGDIRLIFERLERVDERFEDMNRRFEEMNSRFEELTRFLEARFDDVNRRFESVDKRFEDMNRRFESVDKHFEDMNTRFEDMNRRFDDVNKRFSQMVALMSLFFTLLAGMITAFGVLG